MASSHAALLLLLLLCISFTSAEVAVDCCLTVSRKRPPLPRLQSYILQEAGRGCPISAARFLTRLGRTLCAPHPADARWVRAYVRYLKKNRREAH